MRYLKGILFATFLSFGSTSLASGPGFDGDDYDLGAQPYYGDSTQSNYEESPASEEQNNIESIRRIINNDNDKDMTVKIHTNNNDSGLKFGCDVTPSMELSHLPTEPIKKTNNLIRKPGSAIRAEGQYIVISGQVVDRDCLPISNAVIKIWQADTKGKYLESYNVQGDWSIRDSDFDKNFAYSGSTQTNNLGEYTFLTILPSSLFDELAPHINIEVKHPDFNDIKSRIYFNKHPKNSLDLDLKEMTGEERELVLAKGKPLDSLGMINGREYDFNITLEGINKFRRY